MNHEALKKLAENAQAFAKTYTRLVEALRAEGVPEDVARREARATAALAAVFGDEQREPWEER